MILIRLQGCNLRCSFCDTKETWAKDGGAEMSVADIVEHVQELTRGHRWALITGGEPTMQDLRPLINNLHSAGYLVALETNGTLPIFGALDWICVSPKGPTILSQAIVQANEVKYIVKDEIPEPEFHGPTICLQPESQDPEATALCIKAVQERGWRLSVQLHKYLNLP